MIFDLSKLKIKLNKILSFNLRGDGNMYVLGILGAVIAGSYFLTGGLIPQIDQKPENPQIVQIDPNKISANEDSLQLINLVPLSPSPTPSPSPSPTPPRVPTSTVTPSRQPTPTPEVCLDKTVITLLLDVSTSMRSDDKIGKLNTAMSRFVSGFTNDMVIGAVQFAGPASFPSENGISTLLPYTRYGSNSSLVRNRLTTLSIKTTSANDGTYMRNAFARANNNINNVETSYRNQGYQFVTVLFTDGVPETQYASDSTCVVEYNNPYLCFARAQDPRSDQTRNLKDNSNKVYAIGLYTGSRERQALSESRRLLSEVVSNSSYDVELSNPDALNDTFNNILQSACQ